MFNFHSHQPSALFGIRYLHHSGIQYEIYVINDADHYTQFTESTAIFTPKRARFYVIFMVFFVTVFSSYFFLLLAFELYDFRGKMRRVLST